MTDLHNTAQLPSPNVRPIRDRWQAILRGLQLKCPQCGTGQMFGRYLKVNANCPSCGEALHHHKADDAPAYFTIFVVGHIIIAAVLWVEVAYEPSYWVHVLIWPALTLGLSLLLLPMIKGALVGLQWALYMHGFDPDAPDEVELAKHGITD